MQDRPTAVELTATVAQFLNEELAPTISDPRMRFRVLIAANLMSILTRELRAGDAPLRAEWQQLAALLGKPAADPPRHAEDLHPAIDALKRELCARIRAGEADENPFRTEAFAYAHAAVIDKLRIANPRYLQRMGGSPAS